jgi:hypothetical protein
MASRVLLHLSSGRNPFTKKEAVIGKLILIAIQAIPRVLSLNTAHPVPEAQKIPLTKNRFLY